jgi:hypothetical protein
MYTTNVIVHIAGTPAAQVVNRLSRSLAGKQGVLGTRPGVKSPSLVRVDYDPDVTTARAILDFVEEHGGFKAQLVGM